MAITYSGQPFLFGTKAQTLERLRTRITKARVMPVFYFEAREWTSDPSTLLSTIRNTFGDVPLAVRSSAIGEDGPQQSMAGVFLSCLNVNGGQESEIQAAIDKVIASYTGNPLDQVLIQEMLSNISVSGVITTHVIDNGAPYYVLNYDDESGKTDTITGGTGVNKTVLIHRGTDPALIESERVLQWFEFARELETVCDHLPLDIEFVQTHEGTLYLLQVRPITVTKHWNPDIRKKVAEFQQHIELFITERSRPRANLAGSRTILGEMPDWNPAEIIGTSPRPLAVSLYRYLITDEIWRHARTDMGYRNLGNEALMVMIGGRPYIDVRNSFNSLLPANLPQHIAEPLVNAWLDRLDERPELHDKVEFDIAQTILDFDFEATFQQRYTAVLITGDRKIFRDSLRQLTLECLDLSPTGSLNTALAKISKLEEEQKRGNYSEMLLTSDASLLRNAKNLLSSCQQSGCLPFAIIARHAFIAESMLRSAMRREALTPARVSAFKQSLSTVTRRMSLDFRRVFLGEISREDFLSAYGHLRPGTYDILSLRYDQREDLFSEFHPPESDGQHVSFKWTQAEETALEGLLKEAGLDSTTPQSLLHYCIQAISGRELAKFVFSRNLSDALELIAQWGDRAGLTREEISFIPLDKILESLNTPVLQNRRQYFRQLAKQGYQSLEVTRALHLGYLIRDIRDIYVVPLHRSAPNFITNKRIEAQIVFIDNRVSGYVNLYNKIVCIENADPGFDWIFTRGIAGLITQYGGSNSHMAIRAAEFDLPAAIGCGEQTFSRLVASGKVELNCSDNIVRPVYG